MDGMDMGDDTGISSMSGGQMLTYLHASPTGDIVLFEGWVPQSIGAMVGTCIGLFLLAIFERWLAACRAAAERAWARQAHIAAVNRANASSNNLPTDTSVARLDQKNSRSSSTGAIPTLPASASTGFSRLSSPFIPANDLSRGLFHVVQKALSFALMLIVMTFQIGFILALVLGAGVGETLFGRYGSSGLHV